MTALVKTPLGVGEVINQANQDGEVMVILRKRDNPATWKWQGEYVFRLVDKKEVENVE
jgi:hypothetical protein